MIIEINNKNVKVDEKELNRLHNNHPELSDNEVLQLYLEDNDIIVNEEIEKLVKKAKKNKIGAKADVKVGKDRKHSPRTVKISDEKKDLFNTVKTCLDKNYDDVEILTNNKLIKVKINDIIFKVDLIQTRPSKKKK